MFACCASPPSAKAEVVQTRAALSNDEECTSTGELDSQQIADDERFPRWSPTSSAPCIMEGELPVPCHFGGVADASPTGWAASPGSSPGDEASGGDMTSTKSERLSEQVRTFVKKAQQGLCVFFCDVQSLLLSQCLFRIDDKLTTLTLRTALSKPQEIPLKDLRSVVRGEGLKKRAPRLASATGECLLLVFGDPAEETLHCLFFKDGRDRDEFHYNMKVLQVMAKRGAM
mmetsp:Transcript_89423/g.233096  ORF Transcript_89423/g.233096 Transcript_89423/m.233096 type:complete len:229 (-) Transcript_89423:162-848(-)